jgi:hypothetical protein
MSVPKIIMVGVALFTNCVGRKLQPRRPSLKHLSHPFALSLRLRTLDLAPQPGAVHTWPGGADDLRVAAKSAAVWGTADINAMKSSRQLMTRCGPTDNRVPVGFPQQTRHCRLGARKMGHRTKRKLFRPRLSGDVLYQLTQRKTRELSTH